MLGEVREARFKTPAVKLAPAARPLPPWWRAVEPPLPPLPPAPPAPALPLARGSSWGLLPGLPTGSCWGRPADSAAGGAAVAPPPPHPLQLVALGSRLQPSSRLLLTSVTSSPAATAAAPPAAAVASLTVIAGVW